MTDPEKPRFAAVCLVHTGDDTFDQVVAAVPITRGLVDYLRNLLSIFEEVSKRDPSLAGISVFDTAVRWFELNTDNQYATPYDDPGESKLLEVLWDALMESSPDHPSEHPELDAALAPISQDGPARDWTVLDADRFPEFGNIRTEADRLSAYGFAAGPAGRSSVDLEWTARIRNGDTRLRTADVSTDTIREWERLLDS